MVSTTGKGQTLSVDVHSLGARAYIIIFDTNGKKLKTLVASTPKQDGASFSYQLPKSGNYSILCAAGPTNHFYSLTVRIE